MLLPETYPEEEGPIEFRETHVSRLYLTASDVYKVKKPVDFGFLDFTTLARRRFFCAEEVRLNRRFAPDTYLGMVEIRRGPEGIRIGDRGEVLDAPSTCGACRTAPCSTGGWPQPIRPCPAEMERLGGAWRACTGSRRSAGAAP